jgi:hypothetical protein
MSRQSWQRGYDAKAFLVPVGFATEQENGDILITLNCVPVSPRWDGTLKLFLKEDTDANQV